MLSDQEAAQTDSNCSKTLKEIDFELLLDQGNANFILLGSARKRVFLAQLSHDVNLLKKHCFMDYS